VNEVYSSDIDTGLFQGTLPVEEKLDRARLQLLDLSARNRLLNIPRSKARSGNIVEIVDERASEVYRLLVKESKPMSFAPGRASAQEGDESDVEEVLALAQPDDDGVDARGVANRHADNRLQTRLTSKGLQKRLLTLYFDARTLEEEQGVNVLYLALGTLKWIDPNNKENVRFAPLVLVPASLERATAGDRFKLRWRQEEPSSNLSLELMADRNHALKLPQFEATDELDLDGYFDAVKDAVSSKVGWEVAPNDIVLGFFSFAKFLMYRDLSKETWPAATALADRPLIRALLREGFPPSSDGISDDASIDPILPPEALMHIVDSDSSQALAVDDARRGHNLVIQGPPGTGKSQTIANIIAAAIVDGKSVLFVAEKMAALDVVKRRLDAAGVGDACLELHSNKSNKRALLEELRRTWQLGSPRGTFAGSLPQRLTAARDLLNAHAERMHRSHPIAGLTPYNVLGELTRLRKEGQLPNDIALPDATTWSSEGLAERRSLLRELRDRVETIGQPALHPWRGVGLESVLPNQLTRLLDRVGALLEGLHVLVERKSSLAAALERNAPETLEGLGDLLETAQRVASAPGLGASALGNDVWSSERAEIESLLETGQEWSRAWGDLQPRVRADALALNVEEALGTLSTLPGSFEMVAFARCREIAEVVPKLVIEAGRLKGQLGLEGAMDTLAAVSKATATSQRVAAAPDASPEVFAATIWDSGVEQAGELAEAVAKLEETRRLVGERVAQSAWEIDFERERQVVRQKGRGLLRFLSGDWRRSNALLRSLVREPKQPVDSLLELLDKLGEGQTALRSIRTSDALGRAAFGSDWMGEKSRSTPLRAVVAWMRSLRGLGAAPRLIAARLPDRTKIGARANRLQQLLNQARPLLEAFWTDLGATNAHGFDNVATISAARLSLVLARATAIAKCDMVACQALAQSDVPIIERREILAQLRDTQTLHRALLGQRTLGEAAFGTVWVGSNTDWNLVRQATAWVDANPNLRSLAAKLDDRSAPLRDAQQVAGLAESWRAAFLSLAAELATDVPTLFEHTSIGGVPHSQIAAHMKRWLDHSEQLSRWTAYRDRAQRARAVGLSDVVARLERGELNPAHTVAGFEMAYFEALLDDMVRIDGELARFDGELHGRRVADFVHLDHESLQANRVQVVQSHYRRLPPRDGGMGPLGILKGEMAKKKSHLAIRVLMQRAAPAVQALKPVFMMSPLSIAQFLPAGQLDFDLLVMDEASQIQPVDALGAIARCKQVVVVGDERQLPPTRFFAQVIEGEPTDEEEGAQVSDIESILGLFTARGLRSRMLRWHYRSRHQSLIAVSNSQFYENKLHIVPSPYTAEAGMGLMFHHLPSGTFDAGGSGTNSVEAAAVARAIILHTQSHPEQSLGVATFSVRQRRAILDQLEVLRREHPETEAFFHAHQTEPFFVKNLENVQGDERDVIFISVGYGRNSQGVMSMRFGPLGSEGGERRLNVLISRAKLRCEVFSSITDEDIDLERARGKGVVAFKLFLRFARTGRMDLASADEAGEPEVFDAQVAGALHGLGYQVHPRVGISGLFIDLAVADPKYPGRYILGIECDGRTYRQARSARDRDRLRRAVLEDHGWVMHRIWSFDWFHRPKDELARLVRSIDAAKHALDARGENEQRRARAVPVEVVTIERADVTEIGLATTVERSGAPAYQEAQIHAIRGFPDIPSVPTEKLASLVESVVVVEGPVHTDVVIQRIRDAWGVQRAGSRIQAAIEEAVALAVRTKKLDRVEDFLSSLGVTPVARDRSGASAITRRPDLIAPTEIADAIEQVVKRNLGVKRDEVASAVARWLGFSSTSAAIRDLVEAQVNHAMSRGELSSQGDLISSTK